MKLSYRLAMHPHLQKIYQWVSPHLKPVKVPAHYPTDLNIEITTACNSKCRFCTHEELITTGKRKVKHMDLKFAKFTVDRLREMTKDTPDEEIIISPVGLGEPLLHPSFVEIVAYIRKLFPRSFIHANTNCIALSKEISQKIIRSDLNAITFSINFHREEAHKKWHGVDKFEQVVKNLEDFLKLERRKLPIAQIQIFDAPINRKDFRAFAQKWTPYLSGNDYAFIRRYTPPLYRPPKLVRIYPCVMLWKLVMVDVDGYVYPCCNGVWIPFNKELCLGHISEDPKVLFKKAQILRERQLKEDFPKECQKCPFLYQRQDLNGSLFRRLGRAGAENIFKIRD